VLVAKKEFHKGPTVKIRIRTSAASEMSNSKGDDAYLGLDKLKYPSQ
jgi:hypothetical protein